MNIKRRLRYLQKNQNSSSMEKKMLEILVDENGKIRISSEFNPLAGVKEDNPSDARKFESIIDELVEVLFHEYRKGSSIGQIIKALSMADICSDMQPYECMENLWSIMMFSFLPKKEKNYRKLKEKYGFKVKVVEPVSFTDPFMFPIGPKS